MNKQNKNTMRDQISTKENFHNIQGPRPPVIKEFFTPSIVVFKVMINDFKMFQGVNELPSVLHFTL